MEDRIGSTQKLLDCLIETATLATGEGRERSPPICRKTDDSARDVTDKSVQPAQQSHYLLGTTQNPKLYQTCASRTIASLFTGIAIYAELKHMIATLACHPSSPSASRLPGSSGPTPLAAAQGGQGRFPLQGCP